MMESNCSEQYKPGVTGEVRSGLLQRSSLPPVVVQYEVIDGLAIFEGDIRLGCAEDIDLDGQSGQRAIVRTGDQFRWRNGVIPFEIDANLMDPTRVDLAIAEWEQKTSIRFVERTPNHPHYVRFVTDKDACSSPVGRQDNDHDIRLADGCGRGNVIHEIGHTVGLWHEQSREDRDQFVAINWENIRPDKLHNFNQQISDGDDVGPYDYGSIMHYDEFDFAKEKGIPTIVSPQPVGQRDGLSAGDIGAVRRLYYFQRRRDSANAGEVVSEIAAIRHGVPQLKQVLTAVRTEAGRLKLITWQVNTDGSVTLLDEEDTGGASDIAITRDLPPGGRYVVACRTSAGDLKLVSYHVSETGHITWTGDSANQAGEASLISIVPMAEGLFVTAVCNGDGNLVLISWRLNEDGSLTRLHDSAGAAGAVSEISVARIRTALTNVRSGQLVTSVRTSLGALKLIVWGVTGEGRIFRLGDSGTQAGAASLIRSVRDNYGHIITAVRTSEGNLKLISWAISEDGHFVSRLADSGDQGGSLGENDLMRRAGSLISAVRTSQGSLKLIAWEVSRTGWITFAGDSYYLGGEASLISLCPDSLDGTAPIVTAVRTPEKRLRLITWNDGT